MALDVKVGQFTKNTSNGTQAITGVGFTPKIILFTITSRTVNDSYGGATANGGFGAGTTTSQVAVVGQFAAGSQLVTTSAAKATVSTTETIVITSFDADGFTVTISNVLAAAVLINYIALGGSDLTNAAVLTASLPTATGNQTITGAGFQPDSVIFLGKMAPSSSNTVSSVAVGFIKSTTERVAAAVYGSAGTFGKYVNAAKSAVGLINTGSVVKYYEGDLVSYDSDGLTINWSTVVGSQTGTYAVICLKGIQAKAGKITQPAATGNQAITGVGFLPKAVIFAHSGATTDNTVENYAALGIGFTDGTNNNAMMSGSDTGSSVVISTGGCIRRSYGSTTPTVTANASASSLDSDGFTLNWTTTDATARIYNYFAFGSSSPPPTPTPTPPNSGAFFSFF